MNVFAWLVLGVGLIVVGLAFVAAGAFALYTLGNLYFGGG
jgi:hypothetical protein